MKILFLCHRIPYPPDKGDKTRAFHQLRAIAGRHEVDLFTLADDPRDLEGRPALESLCRSVTVARIYPRLARIRSLPYLLTRSPLTIPYFHSASLHAQVSKAMSERSYDRVFVYCSAMAQYIDWTNAASQVPVVLDIVDVDSNKWSQYAAVERFPFSTVFRKEAQDLRAYERRACERSACVLVCSEREAELARQIAPAARVHVVPIGVDTAYFAPRHAREDRLPAVVFTGDMSYFPNREGVMFFARQVLPLIRREIPDTRFLVVGRNPDRRLEDLRMSDGVEVTGYVPDVRPWFSQANVAVVPLHIAAGVQTKILEAMASGLPIVATSLAVQGLIKPVADLVQTADAPHEMANRVVRLLRDPGTATQLGLQGRRTVSDAYSWDRALGRLMQLIEDPSDSRAGLSSPRPVERLELSRASAIGR